MKDGDKGAPFSSLRSVQRQGEDIDLQAATPTVDIHPILLYDGVCGLCNRSVQFILRHDSTAIFRFASLQSALANGILVRRGADPADLDTVYVVLDHVPNAEGQPNESLLSRSDAVVFVLKQLGGLWRAIGLTLQIVPRPLRDWLYRRVANNRYRIFGRHETCPVPTEAMRARFLDV
jgi:predicted DCC family thiol-disulfide oxidoreductase YuxK